MAEVLIQDLDPVVLEKLETLAKKHGRSLQTELKSILEAAFQAETPNQSDAKVTKTRKLAEVYKFWK